MLKRKYLIVNIIFIAVSIIVMLFSIFGNLNVKCTVELGGDSKSVSSMQIFYSENYNIFYPEKVFTADNYDGKFEVDLGKVMLNSNGLRLDFNGNFKKIKIEKITFSWYGDSISFSGNKLNEYVSIVQCGEHVKKNIYKADGDDFGLIFSTDFTAKIIEQISNAQMFPLIWLIYFYIVWEFYCLLNIRRKPHFSKKVNGLLLFGEGILLAIGFVALYAIHYLVRYFGNISWTDIVFHLKSPLEGSNLSTFAGAIIIGCLIAVSVMVFIVCLGRLFDKKEIPNHSWCCGLGIMLLLLAMGQLCIHFDWLSYYKYTHEETRLYENKYADGKRGSVVFPEQKRNLIYIFLESMETTYADEASGGAMKENYMPELTKLAEDNVNFSDGILLNGGYPVSGAGFTLGALVAQTSGVPINESLVNNGILNSSWEEENFYLSGVYSLGDLLDDEGYNQVFMIGSDGSFAGRSAYFHDHRNYNVWDYNTAIEEKKIEEGYYVWWGYEDKKLISFAKESIMELSMKDEPFNFTMLTVDTHFTDGYLCEECEDEFEQRYSNVIACSSRQISEFVEWIQKQPFYENTTIILSGDHLTMDSNYISVMGADNYDRRTYFTIINPAGSLEDKDTYRRFSTLDIYPTTVAALGAEMEGNRLGLGVNLFSEEPTLVEEMGLSELNVELLKNSKYYQRKLLYK